MGAGDIGSRNPFTPKSSDSPAASDSETRELEPITPDASDSPASPDSETLELGPTTPDASDSPASPDSETLELGPTTPDASDSPASPDSETLELGPTTPDASDSPASPDSETRELRRIGSYIIVGEVGRGGMGVVYEARDPSLARPIALKVLPDQLTGDPDALARFQHEARCLAAINHPNIATVFSLEESDGDRFLTMELIDGRTLDDVIAGSPLPIDDALTIGRQIARALEAAHKNGVVHRDLKPLNVMVKEDESVKVLDFGLAKALTGDAEDSLLETDASIPEAIMGSPGYMSPEQVRGEEADALIDIWAFGCVLYECLSGRPAFTGTSAMERVYAVIKQEVSWEAVPPETPPRLQSLLKSCLVKDSAERIDSMARVRRAIEETREERKLHELMAARPMAVIPAEAKSSHPSNLPRQLTTFVGRNAELEQVSTLLAGSPLVTLTGVGGCGKTRLALEAASRRLPDRRDGVWLVELASLSDASFVTPAVASAIGANEIAGKTAIESLVEHVRARDLLIVLDNCEHLLTAAAELVEALLLAAPGVRFLATSRESLGLAGEMTYAVPTLAPPSADDGSDVGTSDAARLFVDRARAVNPRFTLTEENAPALAELCRRLDGMPLALELAAARTRTLSVEDIVRRLDQRFKILTGGGKTALPRHQTLRGLIDWSYEQLEENEKAVFRRLSTFAGGWTLEGAEAVCAGETIEEWEVLDLFTRLVEKSLVERDVEGSEHSGHTRYRMLETMRQYARECLEEKKETVIALGRHRDYFHALAREAGPSLSGPDQRAWLAQLGGEHDNLLLALQTATEGADAEVALGMTHELGSYWLVRGHFAEGRGACGAILARADTANHPARRADVLHLAGMLASAQGDYARSREVQEEALAIRREIGDRAGIAYALSKLGALHTNVGAFETARETHEEALALFRDLEDRAGIAEILKNLGTVATNLREFESAKGYFTESLGMFRERGDRRAIAVLLYYLGVVTSGLKEYEAARSHFEESLIILRELEDRRVIAFVLGGLGFVAKHQELYDEARDFHEQALKLQRALDDVPGMAESIRGLAILATVTEDGDRAARLFAASEAMRERIGARMSTENENEFSEHVSQLRGVLGEEAFTRAWSVGTELDVDGAVRLALHSD